MQESARPAFRVSILAIVLFQVAALFARSMLDISLERNGTDPDVASDLSYLVVPPILLVLMFPYLHRCRHALRQLFHPHLLTLRVFACSVALGLILRLIWWATTTFLIGVGVLRDEHPNPVVGPVIGFECPPLPVVALSFFVMSGLVPIFEEVVHRGFLLHSLVPRGTATAVILSALIFGLMHRSPYLTAIVVGVFLAIQALNYRGLWGPIVTHATFNGAAILDWDCFRIVWNPSTSDPVFTWLTVLSVPSILGAGLLGIFLTSRSAAGAPVAPRPLEMLNSER